MAGGKFLLERGQADAQAVFGQGGGAGQGGGHVVEPGQVAPDQPGGGGSAVAAQALRPVAGVLGVELGARQRRAAGLDEVGQQRRLAAQGVDGEIAGDGQQAYLVQNLGRRWPAAAVGQRQGQARQGAVDEGNEGGGDSVGGNRHAGIMQGAGGAYVLPGARNGTVAIPASGVLRPRSCVRRGDGLGRRSMGIRPYRVGLWAP